MRLNDKYCCYCGEIPKKATKEHVIPKSKGGNNKRSIKNYIFYKIF